MHPAIGTSLSSADLPAGKIHNALESAPVLRAATAARAPEMTPDTAPDLSPEFSPPVLTPSLRR